MINCFVGEFGSGKTLGMVSRLMQRMRMGYKVISNTPIEFNDYSTFTTGQKHYKAVFIPNGKEFQDALAYEENCIFAIDEAAVYLPNIYWSKMPPELLIKFHQVRKYRTDVWYTSQRFGQAVKRLRELTHMVFLCSSVGISPIPNIYIRTPKIEIHYKKINLSIPTKKMDIKFPRLFVQKKMNPDFFHGQPSVKKWERYHYSTNIIYPSETRRIFESYNTMYVVDTSAMMSVRKDFTQPKTKEELQLLSEKVNPPIVETN